MHFFGGDKREAAIQGVAQLMSEDAESSGTRAISFRRALGEHQSQEILVLRVYCWRVSCWRTCCLGVRLRNHLCSVPGSGLVTQLASPAGARFQDVTLAGVDAIYRQSASLLGPPSGRRRVLPLARGGNRDDRLVP